MYFVATKNLNYKNNLFTTTLGFAPQISQTLDSSGLFGGISYSPSFLNQLKIMAEYDTKKINAGAGILLFKHLYLYGMAHELKRFAGGFSYSIYLKT